MKKFLMLILFCITTSCTLNNKEEEFVNPLFYKEMRPGAAKEVWNLRITPTTYTTINQLNGEVETDMCELLKNTETEIALKCFYPFDELKKKLLKKYRPGEFDNKGGEYWTYVFYLLPYTIKQNPKDMFYIRKISYSEDRKEPSAYTGYAIDTPRN